MKKGAEIDLCAFFHMFAYYIEADPPSMQSIYIDATLFATVNAILFSVTPESAFDLS